MKSITSNGKKGKSDSKLKHQHKNSGNAQKTEIDPNDSIFSNNSDVSPTVHRPFSESTKPKHYHKFLKHAGELQQLSEMDANLKQHIAEGGILHLATLSNAEAEAEADDSNNAETAVIESSCMEISQKRLKNIMGPVGDIQLEPPLLSILSQGVVPPSWVPQTLDALPSPLLHLDLPTVKDQHKIDLIHEAVYGRNLLRSMRVKQFVVRCLLLSKEKPFFSFDMLFRVIYHLTNDGEWLMNLAKACNLNKVSPRITNLDTSSAPISGAKLDNLWHFISLQLDTSPYCYSSGEKSFLLSLSLLLTVDTSLDLSHANISSYTSSLFRAADLSILRTVLRAVLDRVAHHHTRLRLCSSVNDWNSNASAFQVWIALRTLSHPPRDSCKVQEEQMSNLDQIYSLVPGKVLEFLEFALSDRNMDLHCDFYQLHSELHILYLLLKFSQVSWRPEQVQSLKDSLQHLTKMFRKYSLNLDGIKIKECIRHLMNRVDMEC